MARKFDASSLRQAADVDDFPYSSRRVTYLLVKATGAVSQAYNAEAKRSLLERAEAGDLLLGAWTGEYRTDVFALDVDLARAV